MSDRGISTTRAHDDLDWLAQHGAWEGVAAILAERRRQIEQLGYDANHDAEHDYGFLATEAVLRMAGAAYMCRFDTLPADARPELAEAAALAAAEIDKLTVASKPLVTDPAEIEKLLHRGPEAVERQQRWGDDAT